MAVRSKDRGLITIATCQAPNSAAVIEVLAAFLSTSIGEPIELRVDTPWQERARAIDAGEIDIGWICSIPYVRSIDANIARYELLATPVRSAPRYAGKPIYFSDIVVRDNSGFRTFDDLRGARWAYNEPGSFSGYVVVKAHLSELGETRFFGDILEEGSHEHALDLIRSGQVDGAAIDSTVLERQRFLNPAAVEGLRVVARLGPNPAPPLVVSKNLDPGLRERLRTATLSMHLDPVGQALIADVQLSRFAAVTDADYEPIRLADAKAASIDW